VVVLKKMSVWIMLCGTIVLCAMKKEEKQVAVRIFNRYMVLQNKDLGPRDDGRVPQGIVAQRCRALRVVPTNDSTVSHGAQPQEGLHHQNAKL
jgi:hypothetical protein